MEQLLTGDIRYLLSELLENSELWELCKLFPNNEKINRRTKELINKKCITEMKNRMKQLLGDNFSTFIELLKKTGAVISGSFIVQCLLNEKWNTDIDIFVPMKGNIISYTPSGNPSSEIDQFLLQRFNFIDYMAVNRYDNFIDNKIQWVRTFSNNTKNSRSRTGNSEIFQVILVDVEKNEIGDFILENFDFDIVKNIYQMDKLSVLNYDEIFSKVTNFKFGNRLGSSIDRCLRYEKRGFKFLNKNVPYDVLLSLYTDRKFNASCGHKLFTFRDLKVTDKKRSNDYCKENCIIKFTHPEDEHYHVVGNHPIDTEIIIIPNSQNKN